MLGVVLLGHRAREHELLEAADAEAAPLEAADQLGDEAAAHGVGLEQDKRRLGRHARFRLSAGQDEVSYSVIVRCCAASASGASQYGHSRHSGLSGERQR